MVSATSAAYLNSKPPQKAAEELLNVVFDETVKSGSFVSFDRSTIPF
jgi:hypothetical protein